MKVIKYLSEEIRKLANASDAEFLKNRYWRKQDIERRIYEIIPFWEVPDKEVRKKAERKYVADISGAKPKEWIMINDKKLHCLDVVGINELLIPNGYFYDAGLSDYGKITYILAEILHHDKLKGLDKFILGEELVCNRPLLTSAYEDPREKYVVGRTKSSEYLTWDKVNALKKNCINEYQTYFVLKGFESFGLKKQEIIAKRPEEVAGKVKEIAYKILESGVMPHELGHVAGEKYFPHEDFVRTLKMAQRNGDSNLENFIRAVDDAIADTIEAGKLSGTYPSIFMDEHRDGLLYFHILTIIPSQGLHTALRERSKLEFKMISAVSEYEKTNDVSILREASSEIFSNATELAAEICDAGDYNDLHKIKGDFDKKVLEELLEMS
jgi:hypothetical protein